MDPRLVQIAEWIPAFTLLVEVAVGDVVNAYAASCCIGRVSIRHQVDGSWAKRAVGSGILRAYEPVCVKSDQVKCAKGV